MFQFHVDKACMKNWVHFTDNGISYSVRSRVPLYTWLSNQING
ncbi:hypothetical protein [Paenibacillus sp.]|nr:hypothetical protein [Paenibacillus sp.]